MTRNYYTTGNYKTDHSTCGSKIYNYDFDFSDLLWSVQKSEKLIIPPNVE